MANGGSVDRGSRAFRSLIFFTLLHRIVVASAFTILAGPALFDQGPSVAWEEHDPASPAAIALAIMVTGMTVELWQLGLELVRAAKLRSAVRVMATPPTLEIIELAASCNLA